MENYFFLENHVTLEEAAFRGSRFSQCFILSTPPHYLLPSKVTTILSNYQQCPLPLKSIKMFVQIRGILQNRSIRLGVIALIISIWRKRIKKPLITIDPIVSQDVFQNKYLVDFFQCHDDCQGPSSKQRNIIISEVMISFCLSLPGTASCLFSSLSLFPHNLGR